MSRELFQLPLEMSPCRYGLMIYDPADRCAGEAMHTYGEYNESEVNVFRAALVHGGSAVDVGAFIGDHTLAMARMAKRVVAFEPQTVRCRLLCANLAINEITNVDVINECAGDGSGDTVSIDSLGLDDVAIIKIDVDGPEVEVLKGAKETIARCQPWLYVEADRPEHVDEIIETLYSFGYTPFWHLAPHFSKDNWRGTPKLSEGLGNVVSIMIVAVPKVDEIEGLVKAKVGDSVYVHPGPDGVVVVEAQKMRERDEPKESE